MKIQLKREANEWASIRLGDGEAVFNRGVAGHKLASTKDRLYRR
ncbi:MAG: hypothetical protein ACE5PM_03820 [Candidatus Hydrothermarchaeales archaeon]